MLNNFVKIVPLSEANKIDFYKHFYFMQQSIKMNVLPIKDTFISICHYIDFRNILKLKLLSTQHCYIIMNNPWMHITVRFRNKQVVSGYFDSFVTSHRFKKYDLRFTNITDESVCKFRLLSYFRFVEL